MKIEIGATGSVVTGNVFDIDKRDFERGLRSIDERLYVRWNPKKKAGNGCWEIRRRPEKKSAYLHGEWNGGQLIELGWFENDLECHIKDIPCLGREWLERLLRNDIERIVPRYAGESHANWMTRVHAEMDYRAKKNEERIKQRALEDQNAMAREHRREIRDFKEFILSGNNPSQIWKYWK